jgi:hypothetical protein
MIFVAPAATHDAERTHSSRRRFLMKSAARPAWPVLIALVLGFSTLGLAQVSQPAAISGGSTTGAASPPVLADSCARLTEGIKNPSLDRGALSRDALHLPCRPMPAAIWGAIEKGKWADGTALPSILRTNLLVVATESRYPEAESLAVKTLDGGRWPSGEEIVMEEGAGIIRSLKPTLDPYRVHLLLDVYEQQTDPVVRLAVLETLNGSPLEESLLPALESYYEDNDSVQRAGLTNLKNQPEKTPAEILARLVRKLPNGPFQEWAQRLARRHPSDPVKAALQERKAPEAGSSKN